MPTYSRTDLTITYGTSNFGGPVATAVVSGGPLAKRTFELKSTEGLSQLDGVLDKPQVHVHELRDGLLLNWHGALRTADMEEALDGLVEYLNDLADRLAAQDAVAGTLYHLRDALGDFDDSLEELNRRDFRVEWENVKAAVVAVDVALTDATREVNR